ncbi:MAG: magnesium/cobalt transporter CorA [Verrucomicrobiota bacterium]|nr:magnesium/cobalt transporter CorA [Verrucomicrobiota bacterium]
MIRSFAFTTQGKLHTEDVDLFLMPTLLADTNLFLWVDLENPTPEEVQSVLAGVFHFHPLSIEDCVTVSSSPKVEEYTPKEGDLFTPYLFLVIHAVDYSRQDEKFATSELDFFLGKNFLVTYHQKPLRTVSLIEERCAKGAMQIARAPDRVAHSLLDALVDGYKPALDELALDIADVEQTVLQHPGKEMFHRVLQIKKKVLHLRQIIGPQSEVLARFAAGEFKLIRPHLVPYFRDVYDALHRIGEQAQTYTDSLTGILQVYLNMSSNQTGEVVKLLTLITVITTPLMMIGTWYGMNFHDMPELSWKHGYTVAGGVTLLSTLATYLYFKKKKWF